MKKFFTFMAIFMALSVRGQELQLIELATLPHSPLAFAYNNLEPDRLYIACKEGYIYTFPSTGNTPFLDISSQVQLSGFETGLLGLAFHPQYSTNGYFYVNYTASAGGQLVTRISRFQAGTSGLPDAGSEQILLQFNQPYSNHNGGSLFFGQDGYLYISTGDGGSSGDPHNNAQNLTNYLGKILRIDVNTGSPYGIPADNPFANATDNTIKEIYAYGLRNPWKVTQDRLTGEIWAGDVGQNLYEEIDIIEKGKNYGWNIMEGNQCYEAASCNQAGLTPPVAVYSRSESGCYSVTGGYVYRGADMPSFVGKYIFGDYCTKDIYSLSESAGEYQMETIFNSNLSISSFGEDQDGELYVADLQEKKIYMLTEVLTSTTSRAKESTKLNVLPNPSIGNFTVTTDLKGDLKIDLIDYNGISRNIYKGNNNGNLNLNYETKGVPSGAYIIRAMVDGKEGYSKKIIIR